MTEKILVLIEKILLRIFSSADMFIALALFFFLFFAWGHYQVDWIKDAFLLIFGVILGAIKAHLIQPGRSTDPQNEGDINPQEGSRR